MLMERSTEEGDPPVAESSTDIAARKRAVRAQVRGRLAALDGLQIESRSQSLAGRLFATSWWSDGEWVFIYIPMGGEVDTRFIVARAYREKKQVAIPRIEGEDLAFYVYGGRTENLIPNQFGILEPDPAWTVIDPAGRFSWAVGLSFAEQLVERVPVTDHDELLEGIVTDQEVIG
jgi:5-formyltetrahydrofolate cyclo-ligase